MERHWLTRPETIRRLWLAFLGVLALTVAAELAVTHDAHFAVERIFGFGALFGFAACAALILVAKLIGRILKRPEDYYVERDDG